VKTFLHVRIDAVGIAALGGPRPRLEPGCLHYEGVVVFPAANRVPVVLRIEGVLAPAADVGRKASSVRPDLTPEIHVLEQEKGPVRRRRDGHPANFVGHVLRETKRIAVPGMRIVRAGGTVFSDRLVPLVQLLAERRQRWHDLGLLPGSTRAG
jgi:hypothetical protein